MQDDQDLAELTLPSVVGNLRGSYRQECLVLTLVFHSDPSRIGEIAQLPPTANDVPTVIGRAMPLFRPSCTPGLGRPLDDPYVSRVALELGWADGRVLLRRGQGASRCQLDGRELAADVSLDPEHLRRGVSILLAHSVVLLLRLADAPMPATAVGAATAAIVGNSAGTAALRQQIEQASATDLDVLIRGETGTGKELVAAAIHDASRRSDKDMVAVNMSAIPAGLAPAVLFGSARGAFTGADKAQVGYFQQAEGGTLFLDEVGDTPLEVQAQLLRALQQREIQVVGGPIKRVDVRLISATDALLQGTASDFRAALRHRLGAFEILLLPLRERPEDIGDLLWHFLRAELTALGRQQLLPAQDTPAKDIARWADLFHKCLRYSWPGNVRELVNRVGQVALASQQHITLPGNLYTALDADGAGPNLNSGHEKRAPSRRMEDVDEEEFVDAWRGEEYEVASIARLLGVSRQAVYRRINASDGMRTAGEVPEQELRDTLSACAGDLRQVALQLCVSFSGLRSRAQQLGIWPGNGA